jgi:hypothetical protein
MSTGPVSRRTTWVAAAAVLVVVGAFILLIRAALGISVGDAGVPPTEVLVGALGFGWPHALAAATAVIATARAASGADGPARLLALVSSGRRGHRDEWGAAMRAELASITGPRRERLRFAVSCAPIALRRGWGWSPWIVAVACGTLFAALTVATSRLSLHGSRSGSLLGVLFGPPQITLLLVGSVAAWKGCSMRHGLEHAIPALIAILVGVVATAGPEGALWAREAGVFILDGDYPSSSLTSGEGAHEALRATLTWGLLLWLPWPVLGAAAGARLRGATSSASAAAGAFVRSYRKHSFWVHFWLFLFTAGIGNYFYWRSINRWNRGL